MSAAWESRSGGVGMAPWRTGARSLGAPRDLGRRLRLVSRREDQRHDQGGSNPRRWPPAPWRVSRACGGSDVGDHRYNRLLYVIADCAVRTGGSGRSRLRMPVP